MNNEPVAWKIIETDDEGSFTTFTESEPVWANNAVPLYTHPAKTLTDEEIAHAKLEATSYKGIYDSQGNGIGQTKYVDDRLFAEAILRKVQEK